MSANLLEGVELLFAFDQSYSRAPSREEDRSSTSGDACAYDSYVIFPMLRSLCHNAPPGAMDRLDGTVAINDGMSGRPWDSPYFKAGCAGLAGAPVEKDWCGAKYARIRFRRLAGPFWSSRSSSETHTPLTINHEALMCTFHGALIRVCCATGPLLPIARSSMIVAGCR